MNKYELVYIVDAHMANGAKEEIAKQVSDAIVKSNANLINAQVWLERQKMSFPIKKISEGSYYLLNFEGPSAALAKLNALLNINERILRFLTIQLKHKVV